MEHSQPMMERSRTAVCSSARTVRNTSSAFWSASDTLARMSTQKAVAPTELRERRAAALDDMFESERWTNRKVAAALGLTHTYVGRRRNGELDLTFADVEMFSSLLRRSPEQLFADLRAAESGPESPQKESDRRISVP